MTLLTTGLFHLLLHSIWSNWWSVLLSMKTLPERLWNLFWCTIAWYNVSPCTERGWHDAISLCFGFPLHLDCIAFGARTALIVLQTLLKSLKCDCIKIIRRNHKHIHILITMQSREGEGRKYDIPLKRCQHRSKYKKCLKWEHTVPDWRITNIPVTLV